MFVHRWMSTQVITISPHVVASEALRVLDSHHVKRLPAVADETVVGIIHRNALIRALFVAKDDQPVSELMSDEVVTILPEATLEEAALVMDEHEISALPVVEGARLVGIITKSDIFRAFVRVMGLLEGGQRLTLRLKDRPGALIQALEPMKAHDLNVVSVASCKVPGAPPGTKEITLRLKTRDVGQLVAELIRNGVDVVDWR